MQIMSYSYQFRLKIIKLVTEQDYGIREVAKLHQISHALVIYWLKAFRERGLDGVKSPHTNLQTPKIVKPKMKMKKKDIEIPETTDFSPKAFKKLQRARLGSCGDCLPKGVGGTRPSKTTTEKRKIIESLKPDHALNDLLRVAKMPRSSFYYKEIKRDYHEVKEAILSLYKKNRKREGYRPMTCKLRQIGFNLNHKTVLKLMNELGIHSILRKKRHGKRGKTSHIAPNLLNRDFTATALNQKWVTDVTEFHVGQEKLYFSPLMDLANREIIAYHFSTRPKFSLVKKMLAQGLSRLKPTECPIVHSDQGVLYGTAEWVKMLEGKAVQSMSRRGNCYDNAVIESFFAILKSECFYSRTYHSMAELQAEIEEYLVYYNQKRIKLAFKGLSPVQYRAQYLS